MAMDKDVWSDISEEVEREYIYPSSSLKIKDPKSLHISNSSLGGHAHRVQTEDGNAYYVAPGWVAIRWTVKEGNPLFKF